MAHWRLPAALVSIAVLVAGCGGSSTTSGGGSATAGKKITFVTALIADANWASVNTCFTDHAKQLGMVPTLIAPPNETASNPGMVSLTEQAITTKPDGLVVVPLVAAAFDTVLDKAKSDKIPVVSIILDTSRPDQRIALVFTDPASYGTQGADIVGDAAKGKGNIGILYS